jgi:hypothetical protein
MRLKKHLLTEPSVFDGSQLRSEWTRRFFGEAGEGIVVFSGPFRPAADLSVSLADRTSFHDRQLLHVIVQHQHQDVEKLRLQQRLLLDVAKDKLNHRLPGDAVHSDIVQRWGQDLRRGSQHLSVSIIRMSPHGALIHLGILVPEAEAASSKQPGARVKLEPFELAQAIMDQYVFEVDSARRPIS